jgi:hypothetical protein
MTACFQKVGIRFLYPENWRISEEDLAGSPQQISVQSPGSGFWSLMVYDPNTEPQDLVEQVLQSMQGEYPGVESSSVLDRFEDVETTGYDMCFYCLDFVVNSRVMAAQTRGRTFLVLWQAEDREFEKIEPVFRAITISLWKEGRFE